MPLPESDPPFDIPGIEVFCKAASLGSFSGAALALGVSPAAVSRSVARLERRLGVALFARSPLGVRLTDIGEGLWRECEPALATLLGAETRLVTQDGMAEGRLRVSASTVYAHYRVLPVMHAFKAEYPLVEVDFDLSNRLVDLVRDDVDLAVRMGEPVPGPLAYHTLEYATLGVFAAPAYLARRGEPRSPRELSQHECIAFVHPSSGETVPWLMTDDAGRPADVAVGSMMLVRGDFNGCLSWALAGAGLCQVYHFAAESHVARGELVEVLKDHGGRARRFSAVQRTDRPPSPAARAFVGFLLTRLNAGATPGRRAS